MSEQIRNLNEALEQSTKELNSLNAVLGTSINNKKILNQAIKDEAEQAKENKEKIDKLSNQIVGATKGIINFAKGAQESAGSFAPLGQILLKAGDAANGVLSMLGPIGKIFGGLSKATAEVGNHMIQSFEKAYSTFERVSQTGIVDSFTMFEQSAASMGLTFEDFDRTMSKSSKDMAILGGGALQGTKMMQLLGNGSIDLRRQFQKLGVNTAEANEFQISYLVQQQRMSKGRLTIDQGLIQASGEYVKELDLVSKLTGQTRKELDQGRKDRMQDSQILAGIFANDKISETSKKQIHLLGDVLKSVNPEMSTDVLKMIAAENPAANKDLAQALLNGGVDITRLAKDIKGGKVTAADASRQISDALSKFAKQTQRNTALGGAESAKVFGYFREANDLSKLTKNLTDKTIAETIANQDRQTSETTGLNANMAESKQNLYQASQKIEKLSVSSDIVSASMKHMSRALYKMISAAHKMAGIELPKHVKAHEELMEAIEDREKAEKAGSTVLDEIKKLRSTEGKSEDLIRKQEALAKRMEKDVKDNNAELTRLRAQEEQKRRELIKAEIEAGIREATEGDESSSGAAGGADSGGGGGGGSRSPAVGGGGGSSAVGPVNGSYVSRDASPMDGGGGAGGATGDSTRNPLVTGTGTQSSASGMTDDFTGLNIRMDPKVKGIPEPISGGPSSIKAIELARKAQNKIPGITFTGLNDSYKRGPDSVHAKGLAFDFTLPGNPQRISREQGTEITNVLKQLGASFALDEYNNPSRGATAPHIHAQVAARTGGIMSGPKTGYLAELHGEEAVISNNATKQPLNSAVSNMTNAANNINLMDIYDDLDDKMERLVKILADQHDSQKKYMESQRS